MAKQGTTPLTYLWEDRKRVLGMPLTFTRYMLGEDRIFCEKGLMNLKAEEVLLYRVQDLELSISLGQRICGVGTVVVHSTDKSTPHLALENIKNPREVKEQIHQMVEQAKDKRRMRSMEIVGGDDDGFLDANGDGIDDRLQ